jgi:pyruvate kinase
MDCIRINCAHGSTRDWEAIIDNVRRAEAETDQQCKIAMDLRGPKIRTAEVLTPVEARLQIGDRMLLTPRKPQPSKGFSFQASCTMPELLEQVEIGTHVWIDDGKIGLQVEDTGSEGLVLRVIQARHKGEKLKAHKGLNFPETELEIPALTEGDLRDLDFVARHADIINYSFVQDSSDIADLQRELAKRVDEPQHVTLIAKIETARAIRNLPEIIVQAAGQQPFGVMIARGDLGVELGYKRLAEMQEEILWLCEAAHVPVVWATQVLEHLLKEGTPSRAEMTDAAMAERAECVMLNKGPYIREAVTLLDDVLRRMTGHQSKKTSQMRALRSWVRPSDVGIRE